MDDDAFLLVGVVLLVAVLVVLVGVGAARWAPVAVPSFSSPASQVPPAAPTVAVPVPEVGP